MVFFGLTGPFLRSAFRKRLGLYSYKIGKEHTHKKPGLVPLRISNFIKKTVKNHFKAKMILARMNRDSPRNFGIFGPKGFTLKKDKVPVLDIPNTKDFEVMFIQLKPYVSVHVMKPDAKYKPSQ